MSIVLHRYVLAQWDRFPGFENGGRGFLTSDGGFCLNGFSTFVVHVAVHVQRIVNISTPVNISLTISTAGIQNQHYNVILWPVTAPAPGHTFTRFPYGSFHLLR